MAEYTGFMYAAQRDVMVVEALQIDPDSYTEAIAFHAQQAAEKMVKNVFVQNAVVPNRTHSVDELISIAISSGWLKATPKAVEAATNISAYAVAARYSKTPDIDRGEALQAIADCNTIAKMLADNGYESVSIAVKAEYLHDTDANNCEK